VPHVSVSPMQCRHLAGGAAGKIVNLCDPALSSDRLNPPTYTGSMPWPLGPSTRAPGAIAVRGGNRPNSLCGGPPALKMFPG
jgi:hypothetical protein